MQKYIDALMYHTATNEHHYIITLRHPHIWWIGHHKVRRLAQWYWDGSWHLEGELSMPGWGQITWLNLHSHMWGTPIWEVLGRHKGYTSFKTLQCKHAYLHITFMEIQQRDNKILTAYVHWFKTEANQCDFNSDTIAICIFVKGLWDVHNITAKIYEKDPRHYWRPSN